MAVQKSIHAREVLAAVKSRFLPHEPIWVFPELLANFRVSFEKFVQSGVVFNELPILDQRGIFAQLLRNFPMAIQEPVHGREFTAGYVAVPITITVPIAVPI